MAISGSNDISLLQMGIGLLPVGISLFLSWKYKLGLSKSLIIGVVRGTIQLVAVGYILLWAFRQSSQLTEPSNGLPKEASDELQQIQGKKPLNLPLSCLWWGRLPSPL